MIEELGQYGVWGSRAMLSPQFAIAAERLGYGAVWIGAANGDLQTAEQLLDATTTLRVATGIVNIWTYPPAPVAAAYHRIQARHPGRFVLGVGVGHPEAVGDYARPFQALVRYLDALDAAGVPADRRVLAALGPKVLRLAAERSGGAHPYLVNAEHTRRARDILGPAVLLAPEQKVILDGDATRARALGRGVVQRYLGLSNYVKNLRWLGYSDSDLVGSGSDRLVDDLVRHGDTATVAAALREHVEGGADHVPIQLLTQPGEDPLAGFAALARTLWG